MTAPTPPNYSLWKYRARIRITNPSSLANFPHQLSLTWKPGMRSDFRDIRFTQLNGTKCPYWIETYTARTSATVWVLLPSANQTIAFLYYGNGSVASESSGASAFPILFLDHSSTSGWTTSNLAVSDDGSGFLRFYNATAANSGSAYRDVTIALTQYILEYRTKTISLGTNDRCLVIAADASTSHQMTHMNIPGIADQTHWQYYVGSEQTGGAASEGTEYICRHIIKEDDLSTGMSYYLCNTSRSVLSSATGKAKSFGSPTDVDRLYIGDISTTAVCDGRFAWILLRPYLATEPTLSVTFTGSNPKFYRSARIVGLYLTPGTEYTFDPVNVDHGMVAGVGGQEVVEATAAVAHNMTAAAGGQDVECGAVNIYHPIYPTASWAQIIDPVVDSGYLISVVVSQSMDDAMAEAVFEYDGNEIGNYFSGDYMTKIHVNIPDYLAVSNCVFVGIVPSSKGVFDVAKKKMTMRAVDYGLFLSKQTMDIKDLSLLPPADQDAEGSNIAKTLSCDYVTKNPQIGWNITGATSGATGTIIEVVQSTNGRILTLYPATGKFVDDEELHFGGEIFAYADGRSVDIPYTPYYQEVMPEDWVKAILGGDNWMRVTGIEPYVLESSSGYWDTPACPAVPFMFGSLEKKRDALKRLVAYMDYMWHVKPRNIGTGVYSQSGYFIKQTSIDTLLGLPAAAALGLDDFTVPVTLDQDGEMQVDVVKVRAQDVYGNWMEVIRSNSYYDAGEGPYREFADEPKDICTEADLAAYATDMYNLYSARTLSWSGTVLARSDLQLYQLLTISGMGTDVPDGTYRITRIAYEHGCAKNLTHITFMLSSAFSILRKYGMTYKDSISKVEQIVAGLENRKPQAELATVTATDGWTLTYNTEAGNQGKGRDATSTPATEGVIPVGAKVQILDSRGGVVCIPIAADSDWGSGALTVDEPVIVSAVEDEDDANYWFLTWTPGANNQHVSVNIQTGNYPTAPGNVSGDGSITELIEVSTTSVRVRFCEASTTYYIKIWGERGGRYSAVGDTATIISGADVTPSDGEELEKIKVIDELLASGYTGDEDDGATIEIFSGNLPFSHTMGDNIYIGGPVSDTSIVTFSNENGGINWWTAQPTPRYMFIDNWLTITGPGGTITVGNYYSVGWFAPVNITDILVDGVNSVTITLHNNTNPGAFNPMGVTDLWIRSYYL